MKLWKDCSKQERREVNEIDRLRKIAKERFMKGKLANEEYVRILNGLSERLDECEAKYETNQI